VSLLACSWLSPPRPGFQRRFTLCARPRERGRARELDPWPFDLDQAPLVDFCNQHNPRARPPDRPSPVSGATSAAGVRLRASPASLPGVAFAPPADRIPGQRRWGLGAEPPSSQALLDNHGPRTRYGWRHLAGSLPAFRPAENLRRTRPRPHPRCVDGHQSRFHGSGADSAFTAGVSARGHPFGRR